MKKLWLLVISAAVIVPVLYSFISVFLVHSYIMEGAESYAEETVLSADGEFMLCTQVFDDDGVTYISFRVEAPEENMVVFQCEDRYRAYDFKGIEWKDSDIVVESGDVGTVEYLYENGSWVRKQ